MKITLISHGGDKIWSLELYSTTFIERFGDVGSKLKKRSHAFASQEACEKAAKGFVDLKQQEGYYKQGADLKEMIKLYELAFGEKHETMDAEKIHRLKTLKKLSCSFENAATELYSIGFLENLEELYCTSCQLNKLPESIANLKNLRELHCNNNRIPFLPEFIFNLKNLTHLDCGGNLLQILPESVGCLKKLEYLDIRDNQLTSLPNELFELNNVTYLSFGSNPLTYIPESISKFKKLEALDISNIKLASIPEIVFELRELKYLDLSKNPFRYLPESIERFQNLESLSLESVQLRNLPNSIVKLSKLTKLNLRNSHIHSLPEGIVELKNLEHLNCSQTRITQIPSIIHQLRKLKEFNYGEENQFIPETKNSVYLTRTQVQNPDQFWHIEIQGKSCTIRTGIIGENEKQQTQTHSTDEACLQSALKSVREKLNENYRPYTEDDSLNMILALCSLESMVLGEIKTDEDLFLKAVMETRKTVLIEPLQDSNKDWLRRIETPEVLIHFIEKYSFKESMNFGYVYFNKSNDIKTENERESNALVRQKEFLVIGSYMNGDLVVVDSKDGSVGFVDHEELWGNEFDSETSADEIFNHVANSIGSFIYSALNDLKKIKAIM